MLSKTGVEMILFSLPHKESFVFGCCSLFVAVVVNDKVSLSGCCGKSSGDILCFQKSILSRGVQTARMGGGWCAGLCRQGGLDGRWYPTCPEY